MSTLPRRFLLVILVVSVASCTMFAQTPPAPPKVHQRPIPPQPDSVDQEQSLAYWTTETGWTSELQLRNNAVAYDFTVTPVLRLADGAETTLAAVTLKPQEVKSFDLGAAIAAAAAPQLVGTYGSLALRYRSPSERSLYAAEMIRETGHPVAFHIDAMGTSEDVQVGSREGVWWLPKDTASDYLILTNQGQNVLPVDLALYDAGGKEHRQRVLLGRYETTRFSVRKLVQAAGVAGSYGGIKVSAAVHAGSLDTLPGAPDVDLTSGSCLVIYQMARQVARTVRYFSSSPLAPTPTRKPFNSQSLISHLTNSDGCGNLQSRFC